MKAPADCRTIEEVRAEIDRIDKVIVQALAERRGYVQTIMRFKRDETDVRAPDRQAQVLMTRREWAAAQGVDPDLVERIFRTIVDHFVGEEMNVLTEQNQP